MSETIQYRGIKDFPGYRIGDDGSVWTCRLTFTSLQGQNAPSFAWIKMSLPVREDGYVYVTLYRASRKFTRYVHRLVLESFVGPCPEGMEACHYPDKTRSNNRLRNLRWDTRPENHKDRFRDMTPIINKRCPRCGFVKKRSLFGSTSKNYAGVPVWCNDCVCSENRVQYAKRRCLKAMQSLPDDAARDRVLQFINSKWQTKPSEPQIGKPA